MDGCRIAVIGATGAVGQVFLRILEERAFPASAIRLCASKRSVGKKLRVNGREIEVEEATPQVLSEVDIAFISASGAVSRELAPIAVEQGALGLDAVERVATTVGSDGAATSSAAEGEHTARVTIYLKDGTTPADEDRIIEKLRQRLRTLPEVSTEVSFPALFSFKTPIELEIRGDDLYTLRRLSADAVSVVAALPGLADVRSTLQVGHPELQVVYDRDRLSDYGLELRAVAELVRNKVQGRVATNFRRQERNIDVLVRLRQSDRLGVDELERLQQVLAGAQRHAAAGRVDDRSQASPGWTLAHRYFPQD